MNPFIVTNGTLGKVPRAEVHLPKYISTSKNNNILFGTENDQSSGTGTSCYVSDRVNNYPFAIDLVGVPVCAG